MNRWNSSPIQAHRARKTACTAWRKGKRFKRKELDNLYLRLEPSTPAPLFRSRDSAL